MSEKVYKRNCPKCDKILETKNKYYFKKAVSENKMCGSCSLKGREFSEEHKMNLSKNHADVSGENNPFYNRKHTDKTKKKISKIVSDKYKDPKLRKKVSEIRKKWHLTNDNSFKGRKHTDETKQLLSFLSTKRFEDENERKKISDSLIGNIPWNKDKVGIYDDSVIKKISESTRNYYKKYGHPWTGRNHTDKSKEKMRKSAIKRVIRQGTAVGYNPDSIPIIENFGKENGYNFQHAENGGEFQVPGTTFFVDGYDKEKNVVVEFDEKYHLKEEQQILDKKRQDIIGNILKCKFYRIGENNNIKTFNYEN
jgi:hypothetical protein